MPQLSSTLPRSLTFGLPFVSLFLFSLIICLILDTSLLYAVGITVATACAVLLFVNPLLLLFFLVIIRMSLDASGDAVTLAITNRLSVSLSQAIGLLVFALGVFFLGTRLHLIRQLKHVAPLAVIFFWGVGTLLFSLSPDTTVRELLRVFDIAALSAIAFFVIENTKDFKKLLLAFFLSSVIPVIVGLYQFSFGVGFKDETVSIPRIYGTFSHPNIFSLYLFALIVLATLYFALFADTRHKRVGITLLTLLYSAMLFITYTRIAWLALFVFFFILVFFRFRRLLIPLMLLPVFLYAFIPPLQDRVNNSFQDSPDSSVAWRKNLWKDTVQTTLGNQRFLFGYGMNTFPMVSESLRGIARGSNDPHNDFVKFFVEGGMLGLVAYVSYLFLIHKRLWKNFRNPFANEQTQLAFLILFAFAASLTFASLSDNIFKNTPVQWVFWIVFGAMISTFSKRNFSKGTF